MKQNVPLAPFTYYKIGGHADFFLEAESADEMIQAIRSAGARRLPVCILGAGSNVLFSDAGFRGLVIRFKSSSIRREGNNLHADAGVQLARLASHAVRAGLSGIEWGIGIPGTVGGSVRGNAGAYGGEIKDVLVSAEVYDILDDRMINVGVGECDFGYRSSVFKKKPHWIVIGVSLHLAEADASVLEARVREIAERRAASQDIGTRSAGCVFKNIPWDRSDVDRNKLTSRFPGFEQFLSRDTIPASYCIDAAGLKGFRVGGAEISEKHANYFLNSGDARADDVLTLISIAKDRVRKKFGFQLNEEIQLIGF